MTSATSLGDDYELRVRQQIEQYVTEPIHDLPDIFHLWSHNFIRPGLVDVFGVQTVNDFYFAAAREASGDFARPFRILSVGCGDGSVELELAQTLRSRVNADFKLIGVDLSPVLIERFSAGVREHGLERRVFPKVQDLNKIPSDEQFDVIMANHSLHHIVDLEGVFNFVHNALAPHGIFVTSDMIGRNGHMRWPETEVVLQALWPMLNDKQKFHHQLLKHHKERFEDYDCSGVGFEGVRAQDILYLLLDRFHPYKFFGYGGFIDVLVDRGFGHGFDASKQEDKDFISAFAKINEMMLDGRMISPTMMMAYFTKDDRGEKYYRARTAKSSLRLPFDTPDWATYQRS